MSLDRPASVEEIALDQFTRQAALFAAAPEMRNEAALQLLIDLSRAGPEDTMLDVACGPGLVVCAFARVVRHAIGLDLTPAMVEQARKFQAQQGLQNVTWHTGSARPLPFPDGAFNIVVSRYAFHHLAEPGAVLAEMSRVCAPGGRVVLADVAASPNPAKAAAYDAMERLRDPSHMRALPLAEMEVGGAAAGLSPPETRFYRLDFEMEHLLRGAFPNPGGADQFRAMVTSFAAADPLGLKVWKQGAEFHLSYPIAVLVWRKPA